MESKRVYVKRAASARKARINLSFVLSFIAALRRKI